MKKVLSVILATAMILSLAACGNTQEAPTAAKSEPAKAESTAEASVAPATENEAEPAAENEAAQSEDVDTSDWVKLEMTYASPVPDGNVLNWLVAAVEKKLEMEYPGYFTFDYYCGGTLLGFTDMLDGLEEGIADIAIVEPSFFPTRLPLTQLFYYPGITYNNGSVATEVIHEVMKTKTPAELDNFVYLLGNGASPSVILTNGKVETIADVKGLQLRATSSYAEAANALGAVSVGLTSSEMYEAARSGLISGAMAQAQVLSQFNMQEVTDSALLLPTMTNPVYLLMNRDTFNKMPESQQEAFMECVDWVHENMNITYNDDKVPMYMMTTFYSSLDSVEWANDDFMAEFNAATEEVTANYIQTLNDQGIDGDGYLALIKELADKYNAKWSLDEYKQLISDCCEQKTDALPYDLEVELARIFGE